MPNFLDTNELQRLQADGEALLLVDVRLADDFTAGHLPGAVNNCVFEVPFVSRMADAAPDKAAPVCVYGHGLGSMEAAVAAEKLERDGYTSVYQYDDGLAGWREAGGEVQGDGPAPVVRSWPEGRRELDLDKSSVRWLGRNLLNSHSGTVGISRGHVTCSETGLSGGEIVLDMTDMRCDDLAGEKVHDILIAHLFNDDFFDVERFPEAVFSITEGRFLPQSPPGAPNLEVEGVLRLKDVSKRLTAVLAAGVAPDGTVGAQGTLAVDRTCWNVMYCSGRYFERLAGHLVNDEVELRLKLVLASA